MMYHFEVKNDIQRCIFLVDVRKIIPKVWVSCLYWFVEEINENVHAVLYSWVHMVGFYAQPTQVGTFCKSTVRET